MESQAVFFSLSHVGCFSSAFVLSDAPPVSGESSTGRLYIYSKCIDFVFFRKGFHWRHVQYTNRRVDSCQIQTRMTNSVSTTNFWSRLQWLVFAQMPGKYLKQNESNINLFGWFDSVCCDGEIRGFLGEWQVFFSTWNGPSKWAPGYGVETGVEYYPVIGTPVAPLWGGLPFHVIILHYFVVSCFYLKA